MRLLLRLAMPASALLLAACSDPALDAAEDPPAASAADAASVEETAYAPPRTSWGEPDLRGVWPIDHINGTPVQRPPELGEQRYLTDEEFAAREANLAQLNARYDDEIAGNRMNMGHWVEMGDPNRLTSLIFEPSNGRVPALTPEGEAKSATMTSSWSEIPFEWIDDFNALDRCITRGLPASMFPFMYNSGVEIVQAPGVVAIRLEIVHETRIIPTDGRPPLPSGVQQWLGDSRGRWEGDTLVVETTNFNGESPMLIVGPGAKPLPTSPSMRIVERFTRTADDTIDYEIAVEDPTMLTSPWKAGYPMRAQPDYVLFEYACHEGNQIIRDLINTTRVQQAAQGAGPGE
jgi:hypothetical protein